jgi:hypothetical protein
MAIYDNRESWDRWKQEARSAFTLTSRSSHYIATRAGIDIATRDLKVLRRDFNLKPEPEDRGIADVWWPVSSGDPEGDN